MRHPQHRNWLHCRSGKWDSVLAQRQFMPACCLGSRSRASSEFREGFRRVQLWARARPWDLEWRSLAFFWQQWGLAWLAVASSCSSICSVWSQPRARSISFWFPRTIEKIHLDRYDRWHLCQACQRARLWSGCDAHPPHLILRGSHSSHRGRPCHLR